MKVRIAIPEPTSLDREYNARSLPQYVSALQSAGAEPMVIALDDSADKIAEILSTAHGMLLPGSRFDVDPQTYGEERKAECNEADPARAAADEILLREAFTKRKPLLGICGGMQALNVWRHGTLIQDLARAGRTAVNHSAGRSVEHAHEIRIEPSSRLASIAPPTSAPIPVNSSHHQAVKVPGDNLRITAVCPDDGTIEAIELDSPDQFLLGVQWHPERSVRKSPFSRAIFAALVQQADAWARQHGVEKA